MIRLRHRVFFISAVLVAVVLGSGAIDGHYANAKETARIGVLARRGAEECLKSWTPTAEYLTSQVEDIHFQIVPLTFEQVVPSVQSRDVDFLIINSSIYVELQALYGVSRMATMKENSAGEYRTLFGGVIFCRSDRSDITSIKSLEGKSFMAVDETSMGGWRAAWREFKANGINPYRDFNRLTFGKTHDNVVYAVRDGKVDAGTVATSILEQMTGEGRIEPGSFKIINRRKTPTSRFPTALAFIRSGPSPN